MSIWNLNLAVAVHCHIWGISPAANARAKQCARAAAYITGCMSPACHTKVATTRRCSRSMMLRLQTSDPESSAEEGVAAGALPLPLPGGLDALLDALPTMLAQLQARRHCATLCPYRAACAHRPPRSGMGRRMVPCTHNAQDCITETRVHIVQDVRFDKIVHVRNSCAKALTALQQVAATNHRSDIAHMPLSRPGTGGDLQRCVPAV